MGRRGFLPPSPSQVGGSRARARALLIEMTTRNSTQPCSSIFYPLGRGRGLRSPFPPCPGSRTGTRALPPIPPPNAPGLGKARSRAPGHFPVLEPPTSSQYSLQCLCPQEIFLTPSYEYLMSLPIVMPLGSPITPIPTSSH